MLEPWGGDRRDPIQYHFREPLDTFVLPVLATLNSVGLEILFPRVEMLLPGTASSGHFGLLMPANYQAEKEVAILSGIISSVMRS